MGRSLKLSDNRGSTLFAMFENGHRETSIMLTGSVSSTVISLTDEQVALLHEATKPVPAWHTARFISASVSESGPSIGFVRHADGWVGHTGYKCSTARLESHFHNHEVILP